MDRAYNLWREYNARPYARWACAVIEDANAQAGYRIVDHDGTVADAAFLHQVGNHLSKPHPVHARRYDEVSEVSVVDPGDADHFAEAIRTVPGASLGGPREA